VYEREHVFRPTKIAQSVRPTIEKLGPIGQLIHDQIARRAREQRLTAARDRAQPSATSQCESEVVALISQLSIRRMQRDPNSHVDPFRPRECPQLALRLQRRRERVRRPRERPPTLSPSPCSMGRTPSYCATARSMIS
jgi:hypothetical protein